MHRLLPRERSTARWLERRSRLGVWSVVVGVVAAGLGLLADPIGASQRINLLTPPLWGVVLWNVAVYLLLLGRAGRRDAAPAAGPARPCCGVAQIGCLQLGLRMPTSEPARAGSGRCARSSDGAGAAHCGTGGGRRPAGPLRDACGRRAAPGLPHCARRPCSTSAPPRSRSD
jgi:hypothetical protein